MNLESNIVTLLRHISECRLAPSPQQQNGCSHMGAVLVDAVLQAGLNYTHVVKPRVYAMLQRFPCANNTSRLIDLIGEYGAASLLNWKHPEKPSRLREWTCFFYIEGVESTDDLKLWLQSPLNRGRLRLLRGIGPKTVDYLQSLVGLPAIAVDRHIQTFVERAGLGRLGYDRVKAVMESAADRLNCGRLDLDVAVWRFMSGARQAPHGASTLGR